MCLSRYRLGQIEAFSRQILLNCTLQCSPSGTQALRCSRLLNFRLLVKRNLDRPPKLGCVLFIMTFRCSHLTSRQSRVLIRCVRPPSTDHCFLRTAEYLPTEVFLSRWKKTSSTSTVCHRFGGNRCRIREPMKLEYVVEIRYVVI